MKKTASLIAISMLLLTACASNQSTEQSTIDTSGIIRGVDSPVFLDTVPVLDTVSVVSGTSTRDRGLPIK